MSSLVCVVPAVSSPWDPAAPPTFTLLLSLNHTEIDHRALLADCGQLVSEEGGVVGPKPGREGGVVGPKPGREGLPGIDTSWGREEGGREGPASSSVSSQHHTGLQHGHVLMY